jgi:hypothetical protein
MPSLLKTLLKSDPPAGSVEALRATYDDLAKRTAALAAETPKLKARLEAQLRADLAAHEQGVADLKAQKGLAFRAWHAADSGDVGTEPQP